MDDQNSLKSMYGLKRNIINYTVHDMCMHSILGGLSLSQIDVINDTNITGSSSHLEEYTDYDSSL